MMKKLLRVLSYLLATLMLVCCISGCAKDGDESGETSLSTGDNGTENVDIWAQLPKTNYGGATVDVLIASEHSYEFSESLNGQVLNDEIFKRELQIEAEYGVDIVYHSEPGHWASRDSFNTTIENDITSGSGTFDLINGIQAVAMLNILKGSYTNFTAIESINFDDLWWTHDIYNSMHIGGKIYNMTGSSMLSTYKTAYAMFVNMEILEENKMNVDPIQLTIDGKWTLEKLLQITVDQERDLNDDGSLTSADYFGFVTTVVPARGLQTALDLDIITRGTSGKLLYLGGSEKWYNAVEQFTKLTGSTTEKVYVTNEVDKVVTIFGNGRAIVLNDTIETAEKLLDYGKKIVIVPQPKYDESQENYQVQMGTAVGAFFIPVTTNINMVADIINAHGCLSYLKVVPKYYEDMLKAKYINVPENMQVIDIINNSMTMELAFGYATVMDKVQHLFYYHVFRRNDGDIPASQFEKTSGYMPAVLDELYNNITALP